MSVFVPHDKKVWGLQQKKRAELPKRHEVEDEIIISIIQRR